jgi:hypothetical protein
MGALLFASGNGELASVGRLLQGAGGVFALVGAAYIATTNFPASRAATLIGATQMFGMAGGSAGQFLVGPLISSGVPWSTFWTAMGFIGLVISGLLYWLLPAPVSVPATGAATGGGSGLKPVFAAMGLVFRNPQSILCGVISGLLFIPTTIFDMVWGVRYLQEAHGFDYAEAVLRSATVPFGARTSTASPRRPPPRITNLEIAESTNVASPSQRTAPTAQDPNSPGTRRLSCCAIRRSSTRRTPSTKWSGHGSMGAGTRGCDQSDVSTAGSTRGATSSVTASKPIP